MKNFCLFLSICFVAQGTYGTPIFSNMFGIGNSLVSGLGQFFQGGATLASQVLSSAVGMGTKILSDGVGSLDSALQNTSRQLYSLLWTISNIGVGTLGNTTGLIRDGSLGTITFVNTTLSSVLDATKDMSRVLNHTGLGASLEAAQSARRIIQRIALTLGGVRNNLVNLQNALALNGTITTSLRSVIGNLTILGNNLTSELNVAANANSSDSLLSLLPNATLITLKDYLSNATLAVEIATSTVKNITNNFQDPLSQVARFVQELTDPSANSSALTQSIRSILQGVTSLVPMALQNAAQLATAAVNGVTITSFRVLENVTRTVGQTVNNLQARAAELNNLVVTSLLLPIAQFPVALNLALTNLNSSVAVALNDMNQQSTAIAASTGRQISNSAQTLLDQYLSNLNSDVPKRQKCSQKSSNAITAQLQSDSSQLSTCYADTAELKNKVSSAGLDLNANVSNLTELFNSAVNDVPWNNTYDIIKNLSALSDDLPNYGLTTEVVNTFLDQLSQNISTHLFDVQQCTLKIMDKSIRNMTVIQLAHESCVDA